MKKGFFLLFFLFVHGEDSFIWSGRYLRLLMVSGRCHHTNASGSLQYQLLHYIIVILYWDSFHLKREKGIFPIMLASIKKNYHNHQFHRHSLQIEKTVNHHHHQHLSDHQDRCSTPTPGSPQRSPTFFNKHHPRLHLSKSMPKLMPPSSPTVSSFVPRQRVNESIVLDRNMLSLLNMGELPGNKVSL